MEGRSSRLVFALLLLAAPALGEPVPGGEVHVERSDRAFDCPNEAELVKAALALGTAPAAPGTTPISIAVRFDRDPSAYRATVSASGQKQGERELRTDDADCRRLADSVAVVLAVLLDLVPPEAAASFEPPAAEPATKPAAPKPSQPVVRAPEPRVSAPSAAAPAEPPAPFVASLRAEGAFAYGLLADAVSPYVGGAVSVARDRFGVALGGDWIAPRNVKFERLPNTAVHVGLVYGFADGCWRATASAPGAWEGSICARFAAGVLSGAGRGFDRDLPTHEAWFAAGPVGALRYRATRAFALRFDALALVALGRQTLQVQVFGTSAKIFETLPLSAGVTFGPELSIW